MCSLLFCKTANHIDDKVLSNANKLQKMRGPDYTVKKNIVDRNGSHLLFVHNLLDISGQSFKQPVFFQSNGSDTALLFNGELYNFNKTIFSSDIESLVYRIKDQGTLKPESLDGEYVIVLYNRSLDCLAILTDTFLTKPLYFGFKNSNTDFAVATYTSCLKELGFDKIEMASPNTFYLFTFKKKDILCKKINEVNRFCLEQEKNYYDDWVDSFLYAVEKRASHGIHPCFVSLSSGYDSGAICLALNLLKIKYETFSIEANESKSIMRMRLEKNLSNSCINAHVVKRLSGRQVKYMKNDISSNVDAFEYVHEDAPGIRTNISNDWGAFGLNYIAKMAARRGLKVTLSGAGADEIYSDYGINGQKIYYHSEFGGLFPNELNNFFPWKKFYGDTQRSYLFKDEFIFGRHGIEGRYPYLDTSVVQEFISLSPDLKNMEYKAPIAYFLNKHAYPYDKSVKKGFNPHSQNISNFILNKIRMILVKMLSNQ